MAQDPTHLGPIKALTFAPDGQWQASFGRSGKGIGEFNRPNGVAVDRDGIIYVVDWMNHRVQIVNVTEFARN